MLICFVVAAITDLFDGALARYRHEQTALGSFLDPLADRLLFFTTLFLLAYYQINTRIFYTALFSEIILLILALIFVILLKYLKLKYAPGANIFGKIKATLQVITIFFLYANLFYPLEFFTKLTAWLIIVSVILLYLSFFKHLFYYAFAASNRILR